MTTIIAGKSPFTPSEYRPRTTAARLLNGEPINMAKTTSNNGTTPLPTTSKPAMPAGAIRSPFSTSDNPVVLPADTPKPMAIDFGDGNPPVVLDAPDNLDDHFPRGADGPPIDADASVSPDEQDSPMAGQPDDDSTPPAVITPKTGEPPHWYDIPEQRKMFCDFVTGQIKDYALMDRDETGALKDWTCDYYVIKHQFDPYAYDTFTVARTAIDDVLVRDFANDLLSICKEHDYPKELSNAKSLVGNDFKDAIRAMTGKGLRTAVTGKIAAWEEARHIEQVNANAAKQMAATKTEPSTPATNVEAPKAEPVKQANPPTNPTKTTKSQQDEWHELSETEIRSKYTVKMQGGKDYLAVAGRILLFRQKYRTGNIITSLMSMDKDGVLFRAEIYDADNHQIASGHAYATFANSQNFKGRVCEKAETSAIGRALAHAGFGTDAAGDDVDDDDMLADSPVGNKAA